MNSIVPGVSPARRSRSRWNGAFMQDGRHVPDDDQPAEDRQNGNDLVAGAIHAALSPRRSGRHAAPRARGGRWRGTPASRGCRAGARSGSVDSITSVTRPGPRRHHDDAGREIDRLGDRVRDEADRLVGARPELQQLLVEVVAHDLVERAERLVHQEQVGVEGERTGDRGALLHAAGELPGIFLLEAGEVDEVDRALDARSAARPCGCP